MTVRGLVLRHDLGSIVRRMEMYQSEDGVAAEQAQIPSDDLDYRRESIAGVVAISGTDAGKTEYRRAHILLGIREQFAHAVPERPEGRARVGRAGVPVRHGSRVDPPLLESDRSHVGRLGVRTGLVSDDDPIHELFEGGGALRLVEGGFRGLSGVALGLFVLRPRGHLDDQRRSDAPPHQRHRDAAQFLQVSHETRLSLQYRKVLHERLERVQGDVLHHDASLILVVPLAHFGHGRPQRRAEGVHLIGVASQHRRTLHLQIAEEGLK
mmetsp:Transcript_62159/g.183777  ORF Transcript_62159/g.183777 Transcript_62159/m.183777 type:complete len:267 (-) Transcript_62159:270-1070(-)